MIADGEYVDGSWQLKIQVDDLMIEKTLRVQGDWHIGGVMFKLVETIDVKMNWSDHALWWPAKNKWLTHTRSTLDQYGVQADATLRFMKMHNLLHVQLPDLQLVDLTVNFSKNVFGVVVQMCKDLGIRHPEELSIMRRLDKIDLKRNKTGIIQTRRSQSTSNLDNHSPTSPFGSNGKSPSAPKGWNTIARHTFSPSDSNTIPRSPYNSSTPKSIGSPGNYATLNNSASPNSLSPPSGYMTLNGGLGNAGSLARFPASLHSLAFEGADETHLANSPYVSAAQAFELSGVHRPKNFIQRSRMNSAWLDSSKSLMEQGLDPNSEELMVLLRFKYYNFYDLNSKYDAVRINQLYQQARWSILSEEIECTEEEMMMFSALQLQIELQAKNPKQSADETDNKEPEDEIDAILDQLTVTLEGTANSKTAVNEIDQVPELKDHLKFFKPRRFSLKHYKSFFMVLRDCTIYVYKSEETSKSDASHPVDVLPLRGAEIQSDVNIHTRKLGIRLFIPADNGMQEIWIRCNSEESYANWMAACKLGARGKTMASKDLFDSEKQTTMTFLKLQAPKAQPSLTVETMPKIDVADFVASRFIKKLRHRSLLEAILKAHGNVLEMSMLDAMHHYIKAWQRLPLFGVTFFVGHFNNSKKEELLGVASHRIMRMDLVTGDSQKTWRYSEMKAWNVNWETKEIIFNMAKDQVVTFCPVSAACKIIHEMIGGYIFINMRTPEKNQELDEATFHKFTGVR